MSVLRRLGFIVREPTGHTGDNRSRRCTNDVNQRITKASSSTLGLAAGHNNALRRRTMSSQKLLNSIHVLNRRRKLLNEAHIEKT